MRCIQSNSGFMRVVCCSNNQVLNVVGGAPAMPLFKVAAAPFLMYGVAAAPSVFQKY